MATTVITKGSTSVANVSEYTAGTSVGNTFVTIYSTNASDVNYLYDIKVDKVSGVPAASTIEFRVVDSTNNRVYSTATGIVNLSSISTVQGVITGASNIQVRTSDPSNALVVTWYLRGYRVVNT